MMQNGQLYQLHNLALLTCVNDGFALPTPASQSGGMGDIDWKRLDPNKGLNQSFYTKQGRVVQKSLPVLAQHGLLPTPTCNDAKNNFSPSQLKRNNMYKAIYQGKVGKVTIGKTSRLNPHFVTEMMGFPIGWLDLEP
jgi:hypothetical protein